MPLPQFKHFSYRDAAEELGISIDKLKYLLEKGYLRHAIAVDKIESLVQLCRIDDVHLSPQLLRCLRDNDLSELGWRSTYEVQPRLKGLEMSLPAEYLYIPHAHIRERTFQLDGDDPRWEEYFLPVVEDLAGNFFWLVDPYGHENEKNNEREPCFTHTSLGKLLDKVFFENGCISAEEIALLLDETEVELKRTDKAAKFIQRYYNLYLHDHHGEDPSADQFILYASKMHNGKTETFDDDPDDLTEDEFKGLEDKDLIGAVRIEGRFLTNKNLNARLSRLKAKRNEKQENLFQTRKEEPSNTKAKK